MLVFLRATECFLRLVGKRRAYGILKLDLGGELAEGEEEQRLLGFVRRAADDYFSLIALLRWARDDARLKAVFIRCDDLRVSWARLQGLRRSIERLRQAGKQVWMHLDGGGIREYFLAAAADRVSLLPSATLDITGLSSEAVFFLGALEKLGIAADVVQMGKYKAAGEMFTRREMSSAHREMMESLVDDVYGQVVDGVAESRRLEPAQVREIFDRGPFLAAEALEARLVDELGYEDEIEAKLVAACDGAAIIERHDYARRRSREMRERVLRESHGVVGVLHVGGTIKTGESIPGPEGVNACGASTIKATLKDLRERDDIRAVLVRVNSPGGSGVASDLIWRELVRTREKKPVVVSLGDVAASGGYYVAVAGAPVIAEAGTITGSIGVVAGKANLRGLYDHLGITKEMVQRGRHAALYSDYVPLGEEERARIRTEAQHFYDDFVDKVAAARRLTREAVSAVAEGRVWTGRQAWTRGLVDELGGFEEALDAVKKLAGIPVDAPVALERVPRPRRLWKLSFDLPRHDQGRLGDLLSLFPNLRFMLRERVWAILPFHLRFH
jgi:protease-4